MMQEILAVGIGGFLGSCARFGITKWASRNARLFPLGTLLSNVIAGFLIGFFIGMERNYIYFPPKTKLFVTTGLLGGLSTFSTFNLETIDLFVAGAYLYAVGNILLNLGLSFAGVTLGLMLSKAFVKA